MERKRLILHPRSFKTGTLSCLKQFPVINTWERSWALTRTFPYHKSPCSTCEICPIFILRWSLLPERDGGERCTCSSRVHYRRSVQESLGAINRSIKGPFYFGESPTYVDFAACSYLDMCEAKWLGPLEGKSGDTIAMYAPKLRSIASAIRGLKSAEKRISKMDPVAAFLILKPERAATWQE